jgi:DNA polymerase I-like protein with 3'-5' exonuclease and polymerase domains
VALRRQIKAVLTKEHLDEVVARFLEFDVFAFDTETKGPGDDGAVNPLINEVTWISLAGPGIAVAIPVAHEHGEIDVPSHQEKYRIPDPNGGIYKSGPRKGEPRTLNRTRTIPATFHAPPKQLSPGYVFDTLEPLFFSDRRKIGHNVKFDLKTISKYYDWWTIPGPFGETTSLHHLLDENRLNYKLGPLTEAKFGAKYPKIGAAKPHLHPFAAAALYAMRDAKYTWLLWTRFLDRINAQRLNGVLRMEMDLLPALIEMEMEGVALDRKALDILRDELIHQRTEIEKSVFADAKKPLNLAATADKAWYIYDHRGHEPEFFTKKTGKPSTKAAHLERFARKDKMVAQLLDHASVTKILGTYVDGMIPLLETDGRLHADFVPYGTVTGRFSCREPNLQNIPRVDDDEANRGRLIRSLFVAPEGYSFVAADYDQIELRVLAHFSRDPAWLEIFENDLDPHAGVSAQVLRKPIEEVTKDERQAGKTTNFLIGYGGQADRLAAQTGMGKRRAEEFIEDYWVRFAGHKRFMTKTVSDARSKKGMPYTTTLLGRRRRLPLLRSADFGQRKRAERQCVNAKIQGSSADIIKIAMIRHHDLAEGTPHKLVLSVHDELIAISPDDRIEEGKAIMEEAMLGEQYLRVPLKAKAVSAKRWSECK